LKKKGKPDIWRRSTLGIAIGEKRKKKKGRRKKEKKGGKKSTYSLRPKLERVPKDQLVHCDSGRVKGKKEKGLEEKGWETARALG